VQQVHAREQGYSPDVPFWEIAPKCKLLVQFWFFP
jgi:hypothetical protein